MTDNEEDTSDSAPKGTDYYVFRSPADRHCAVGRMGEGGTIGWTQLHGPDSYQGCWGWIQANCRGGPYYHC